MIDLYDLHPHQDWLPTGAGFWEEPLDSVIEEDEEDSGSPPAARSWDPSFPGIKHGLPGWDILEGNLHFSGKKSENQ